MCELFLASAYIELLRPADSIADIASCFEKSLQIYQSYNANFFFYFFICMGRGFMCELFLASAYILSRYDQQIRAVISRLFIINVVPKKSSLFSRQKKISIFPRSDKASCAVI